MKELKIKSCPFERATHIFLQLCEIAETKSDSDKAKVFDNFIELATLYRNGISLKNELERERVEKILIQYGPKELTVLAKQHVELYMCDRKKMVLKMLNKMAGGQSFQKNERIIDSNFE